jgi:hypothetical protein
MGRMGWGLCMSLGCSRDAPFNCGCVRSPLDLDVFYTDENDPAHQSTPNGALELVALKK